MALHAPTFATLSSCLPPCPRSPPVSFPCAPPLGLKSLREGASSEPDLRDGAEDGGASTKKVAAGMSRDKEWVPSLMGEIELNGMVEAGVLPNRVTVGWRPTNYEPYLMSHTNEVVVFEDYFWHGLGLPIHPFLYALLEY